MTDVRTVALVAAAGNGTRLELGAKAFLRIGGVTVVERVVSALEGCVGRVLVGTAPPDVDRARQLLGGRAEVVEGKETRQGTIGRLLDRSDEELIVVQDVARPFVSRELVMRVIEEGTRSGAAAAVLQLNTPTVTVRDGAVTEFVEPPTGIMQTPQVYRRDLLVRAYRNARETGLVTQSTTQLLDAIGEGIRAVPGEEANFKLTTSYDWLVATSIASALEGSPSE